MSATPAPGGGSALRTSSWVLYDLANTVYSAQLTFLFTPYVKATHGELTSLGVVTFVSMVAAAVLVPLFGALTDHTRRTRRYLVTATLACIAATAGFGIELGLGWLLLCYFAANLAFNLSLLFYNALLPTVAPPQRAGRIGGLGVGVGYGGTILVLAVLLPLQSDPPGTSVFWLAALMFLGFALPCLIFVADRRPPLPGSSAVAMRAASRSAIRALRTLPRHRALMWFLLANFCFVDVLNTAILYFAELTESVFGDDGPEGLVMTAGLMLNGLALVFGIAIGGWTDRRPLQVMALSGVALLVGLVGGAVFGGHSVAGYLATMVTFGAFGLTGIWTAGRKLVILLAPPEQVGQYFGLYGITVKLSVFGAVVYGLVADHFGTKPALLSQTPQLLLGLLFLSMVRIPRSTAPA